jgi:phage tail-like protein
MSQTETTTYFLLDHHQGRDAHDGWRMQQLQNLQITAAGLCLAPLPGSPVPLQDARGTFGGLENPTGVAVDSDGVIYVSDSTKHLIFKVVRRAGLRPWAHFFRLAKGPFANDLFVYVPTANRLERWPRTSHVDPQNFSEVEVLCEAVWDETQACKCLLAFITTQDLESIEKDVVNEVEMIEREWEGDYPAPLPAGEICQTSIAYLPCLGGLGSRPRQFNEPRGLAISPAGNLYVADSRNHRIQVFALRGLVLKSIWGKRAGAADILEPQPAPAPDCLPPEEQAVHFGQPLAGTAPGEFNELWDVAVDRAGNVYIADKGNHRVQKFDCRSQSFIVLETDPPFESPTHLAIDAAGRLYVVDQDKEYVTLLDREGRVLGRVEYVRDVPGHFKPTAVTVDAEGKLLLANGDAIHRFHLEEEGCHYAGCYSKQYGPCTGMAGDVRGHLFSVGGESGSVAEIPSPKGFKKSGTYISRPLDSHIERCQWHKILLDFENDIPIGTSVTVWTYTSEDEQSPEKILDLQDEEWQTGQTNAKDFLILSPPGRFLWLKIKFEGNGIDTPTLRHLKAYFPRLTYMQYLPAVYQADPVSKDFLERFLAIFETILSGIEGKIDNLAQYFDPDGVPEDFLPWIAAWVDMVFDPSWRLPLLTQRQLLRNAPALYRQRGTPAGLKQLLRLALGLEVQILEHFQLRRWLFLASQATLGNRSQLWGNCIVSRLQLEENARIGDFALVGTGDPVRDPFHVYAHKFSVFVPAAALCRSALTGRAERMLRHFIEHEKPAHTDYVLCKVEARFRVGIQATIGFDTLVGAYPRLVLNYCAILGYDTLLSCAPEEQGPATLKVGERARVGVTAVVG